MSWRVSSAIQQIREFHNLTQKEFGISLEVTPAHISSLESGHKIPSRMFLRLLSLRFHANMDWLETGEGEPFTEKKISESFKQEQKQKHSKTIASSLIVVASVLGPVIPAVAAGLAIGVGASEIIDKMQKAYGARNVKDLADNHLNVDRTSMAHWVSKNNVPRKYLEKAVAETGQPLEFFLLQEEVVEEGVRKILEFTREQIEEDRKSQIDLDSLEERFRRKFEMKQGE